MQWIFGYYSNKAIGYPKWSAVPTGKYTNREITPSPWPTLAIHSLVDFSEFGRTEQNSGTRVPNLRTILLLKQTNLPAEIKMKLLPKQPNSHSRKCDSRAGGGKEKFSP